MNLEELIEVLDQRFGNPLAIAYFKPIQQAVEELRRLKELDDNRK